jgi:hypothetical protein
VTTSALKFRAGLGTLPPRYRPSKKASGDGWLVCWDVRVVEGHLLGPLRPLEPLVAWRLPAAGHADLRCLQRLLEAALSESAPEQPAT